MNKKIKVVTSLGLIVTLLVTVFFGNGGKVNAIAEEAIVMPKLEVQGRKLIDTSTNKQVQLRGVSTHGIAWYPEYVNKDAFSWLKENMGVSVIRVSMYTSEWGGYCVNTGNKKELKALIKNAVEYATELGLYVIIDWHMLGADEADMEDCNPMKYVNESKEFFGEMSLQFKDYNNVIYEICNEPNDGEYDVSYDVNWNVIKEYANQVIPVIRKNTDNVIIVGTPDWSSDVTSAANDLNSADSLSKKYDNIMYTYHFYAASHGNWYRNNVENALKAGLPIFVTEFDASEASGDGRIDKTSTDTWLNLLDSYGVSYVKWNLSNKDETSALIVSSCNKINNWNTSEISECGQYMKGEYLTRIQENKYGISAPEPLNNSSQSTMPTAEINGFQIGVGVEGIRTVYSVNDPDEQAVEVGLIYGMLDNVSKQELVVDGSNSNVFRFTATEAGKSDLLYSQYETAQSYAMTMKYGAMHKSFFTKNILVRAYVKHKDGTYIYSDVEEMTVFDVADYLYKNQRMNNINSHQYLYNNILSQIKSDYEMIDYEWNNTVVQPYIN